MEFYSNNSSFLANLPNVYQIQAPLVSSQSPHTYQLNYIFHRYIIIIYTIQGHFHLKMCGEAVKKCVATRYSTLTN